MTIVKKLDDVPVDERMDVYLRARVDSAELVPLSVGSPPLMLSARILRWSMFHWFWVQPSRHYWHTLGPFWSFRSCARAVSDSGLTWIEPRIKQGRRFIDALHAVKGMPTELRGCWDLWEDGEPVGYEPPPTVFDKKL